jgi:hypothetical protein
MRKIRIFEHTSLDGVISPDKRNEGDDDFADGRPRIELRPLPELQNPPIFLAADRFPAKPE